MVWYATEAADFVCARAPCQNAPMVRVKTRLGWQQLCSRHYADHWTVDAIEFCDSEGLDTIEKQRDYIVRKLSSGKLLAGVKPPPLPPQRMREPGEDDE